MQDRWTSRLAVWVPLLVVALLVGLVVRSPRQALFRSLDFTGGVRLEYVMDPADAVRRGLDVAERRQEALRQAKDVFLYRLKHFDLTENAVKTLGDSTIIVEVPDARGVEEAINRTGYLTFRECTGDATDPHGQGLGKVWLTAEDIDYRKTQHAAGEPTSRAPSGEPRVDLYVKSASVPKLVDMTRSLLGKFVAICLDDEVKMRAKVLAPDLKVASITGFEEMHEARDLAAVLKAGYLPVSFKLRTRLEIGPRLGADLRRQCLHIAVLALVAVLTVFCLRYFNHWALLCIGGLSYLVGLLALPCLVLSHASTLSSATMCAYVTLMGMCVDNLILVFEQYRVAREVAGLGPDGARGVLKAAYESEYMIILGANAAPILALLPLWFVAGPVGDLAWAMFLGLLVMWFATVLYARKLSLWGWVWERERLWRRSTSLLPLRISVFDRRLQTGLLVLYLAAVAGSIGLLCTRRVYMGVDLQGGTEMVVAADEGLDVAELRASSQAYFGERTDVFRIQETDVFGFASSADGGPAFRYAIRLTSTASGSVAGSGPNGATSPDGATAGAGPEGYVRALKEHCGSVHLESVQSVGGTDVVANRDWALAMAVAGCLLMCGYMWWWYGRDACLLTALAMATDACIVVAAVVLLHVQFCIGIMACIMTVLAFSVNDSILLCANILKVTKTSEYQYRDKGGVTAQIHAALRPLSSRVLLTLFVTASASVAMCVLGRDAIHDFGQVLTVGVVFGMLSSVTIVAGGMARVVSRGRPPAAGEQQVAVVGHQVTDSVNGSTPLVVAVGGRATSPAMSGADGPASTATPDGGPE